MLGLLALDTRFPRPPGDLGRGDAWGVPVLRRVVARAAPSAIVRPAAGADLDTVLPPFVQAARELAQAGVQAITTSCGFLVLAQQRLQEALPVPVVTSSLLLLPQCLQHERRVGVLTIDDRSLGEAHLLAAGVPRDRLADVVVQGVAPAGHFASSILGDRATLDLARAAGDVVAAALALRQRDAGLRTVVLECTNMPPYRQAVEAATGLRTLCLLDHPVLRALAGAAGRQ
ncbi:MULTISPECIES: aspartate/glutamate racemase family protein [Ramlibacter]|uniref:aspartate/glutamate racemase family protein n=1 Tax=Ramlibacter TaxID=174951 RepID=UPI0015EE9186|nr:aspartate/glutamate racemase family protein [Ramlibacter sp. CGMCC 1.13660]